MNNRAMSNDAQSGRHPEWYRDAVFYSLRVPSFYDSNGDGIGDLRGLTEKLDYLHDLGVTALWLLPFYPSPQRDDGYDISDYTGVQPSLGGLDDFKEFLHEAHRRGLKVVTELVLNHTSDRHPWFQRARQAAPHSAERDYYVWSDTPERYVDARIIFKDFERSNWTWDPVANAYYWHRFYSHQPDLNFDNPAVKAAMLDVLDFWLELGVDGLRLDAVPYLFEREGTNCENLPETFAFLEQLRAHVDSKFQDRMLLAEANQWPEDAVRYLEGGNKCQMAFHFPIMPRMFMALHMEDRFPIIEIMAQTPPLPEGCQWGMFLRNHDELTLEMVTDEERDYMYEAYGKDPTTRINLGIRRRLAPLLNNNRRKLELLNSLLFSLPGTPILYYGDEIGMGDNVHLGDRNGVRTPMQWSGDRNGGFSRANPQRLYLPLIVDPEHHFESTNVEAQQGNPSSLLWWTKRLIALRKRYPVLGRGSCEFLNPGNPKVLAFIRELGEERMLVVVNLSRFAQYVELDLSKFQKLLPVEVFGRTKFPILSEAPFVLTPSAHAVYWFALEVPKGAVSSAAEPEIPTLSLAPNWLDWLEEGDFSALNAVLPEFLKRRRWFGGKARSIIGVEVAAVMPLPMAGDCANFVVEVSYADGPPDRYHVPLLLLGNEQARPLLEGDPGAVVAEVKRSGNGESSALLFDAFRSPEFCGRLLALLQRGKDKGPSPGQLRAELAPWMNGASDFSTAELQPCLLAAEQSNTCIVFGNRFILKVFRRAEVGKQPDLELGLFLTERARYPNTPRLAGWLEYRAGQGDSTTFAVLHEYMTEVRSGWEFAREDIKRYFERSLSAPDQSAAPTLDGSFLDLLALELPHRAVEALGTFPAFAELLGRRAAEMHLALAGDSSDEAMKPEPYGTLHQRSIYQSLHNLAKQVLRDLNQRLPELPADLQPEVTELLQDAPRILACFETFRSRKMHATRIRHHGDLHLGQVLHTGKDILIIDFEGEPARPLAERLRKRSALRDVAGMLRSFHYAVASTLRGQLQTGRITSGDAERLESWSQLWYRAAARAFLKRYLETATGASFIPADHEELAVLLDVFMLEKALYEVRYELNNRPAWLPIPLAGIRSIIKRSEWVREG